MPDVELLFYEKPLGIAALEGQLPENVCHKPGNVALMFLGDMIGDRSDPLTTMRTRYVEAFAGDDELSRAPIHPFLWRHIVVPLKEAKQCYVLKMPIACIAQAGLVGEMVAIWRFQMLGPEADNRLKDDDIKKITGDHKGNHDFDSFGQKKRVDVLKKIDHLDQKTIQAFSELRSIRRTYLHFMVTEKKDEAIDTDARRALKCANVLITQTLGMSCSNGKIVLPQKVMTYIRNIVRVPGQPEDNSGDAMKGGAE